VLTTCPGLHSTAGSPGFKLATYRSQRFLASLIAGRIGLLNLRKKTKAASTATSLFIFKFFILAVRKICHDNSAIHLVVIAQ